MWTDLYKATTPPPFSLPQSQFPTQLEPCPQDEQIQISTTLSSLLPLLTPVRHLSRAKNAQRFKYTKMRIGRRIGIMEGDVENASLYGKDVVLDRDDFSGWRRGLKEVGSEIWIGISEPECLGGARHVGDSVVGKRVKQRFNDKTWADFEGKRGGTEQRAQYLKAPQQQILYDSFQTKKCKVISRMQCATISANPEGMAARYSPQVASIGDRRTLAQHAYKLGRRRLDRSRQECCVWHGETRAYLHRNVKDVTRYSVQANQLPKSSGGLRNSATET
ncbi:hypothetical protein C8J57DRAFT_1212974 [Mycena rebaudengoi]|nr:hypothetical protein C8J57DRAFT_1212974 [Mycena rebaudengoi]